MSTAQMIVDLEMQKTDREACLRSLALPSAKRAGSGRWFFFNDLVPLDERPAGGGGSASDPKEGALSDDHLADVGLLRNHRGAWMYAARTLEDRLKQKEREVKQKDQQIRDLQEQLRRARGGSAKRGHDEDTAEFLADSPEQQRARQ